MKVTGYAKSVVGSREMNQDSFLVDDGKALYAVADGVGGGLRGEVASKMATDGLKELAPTPQTLRSTITKLQERVLKEALDSIGEALMGTTLTTLLLSDEQAYLGHV